MTAVETNQRLIVPVILCGGSGTRLWPVSRENRPKQLLPLLNDFTLLQNTLRRALRVGGADPSSVIVVTTEDIHGAVKQQISDIDPAAAGHIICEPAARNTAPAIALAAQYAIHHFGEDAVLWILPSDHYVGNEIALSSALQHALVAARNGRVCTFGIQPTRPETGYGYMCLGAPDADEKTFSIERFVEKPDPQTAQAYLDAGNYLWNSGMFVFTGKIAMEQYRRLCPDLWDGVSAAAHASEKNPAKDIYGALPSIAFDKAIMEKADNIAVVPCSPQWSDLGSWQSLWEIREKDSCNNVVTGAAAMHDAQDCYIQSNGKMIAVAGVDDLVIVETDDVILVTRKSNAESVKELVGALKRMKAPEINAPASQPWTIFRDGEDDIAIIQPPRRKNTL